MATSNDQRGHAFYIPVKQFPGVSSVRSTAVRIPVRKDPCFSVLDRVCQRGTLQEAFKRVSGSPCGNRLELRFGPPDEAPLARTQRRSHARERAASRTPTSSLGLLVEAIFEIIRQTLRRIFLILERPLGAFQGRFQRLSS